MVLELEFNKFWAEDGLAWISCKIFSKLFPDPREVVWGALTFEPKLFATFPCWEEDYDENIFEELESILFWFPENPETPVDPNDPPAEFENPVLEDVVCGDQAELVAVTGTGSLILNPDATVGVDKSNVGGAGNPDNPAPDELELLKPKYH